jgi:hypothetical protein
MSRSHKKCPGFKDYGKFTRFYKRLSNRKARKNWELPNGNKYKRNGLSWSIHDWNWRYYSKREVRESSYAEEGVTYKLYMK